MGKLDKALRFYVGLLKLLIMKNVFPILFVFNILILTSLLSYIVGHSPQSVPKPKIDLPEEYRLISHDANHPDTLTAYYKDGVLILGFKH